MKIIYKNKSRIIILFDNKRKSYKNNCMNLKKKKYDTLNQIEEFDETNFIFGNSIKLTFIMKWL